MKKILIKKFASLSASISLPSNLAAHADFNRDFGMPPGNKRSNDKWGWRSTPEEYDDEVPMVEYKKGLFPVAVRFVPNDQWFVSHINRGWTIKETKQWLLSRCLPTIVSAPGAARSPSPILFASTTKGSSESVLARDADFDSDTDSVDTYGEELSRDSHRDDSLDAELDGVLGSEAGTGPGTSLGHRHSRSQASTFDSFSSAPNLPPGAANDPASRILRDYALYSFSDGYRFNDGMNLSDYKISPHSLLELHRVGAYVAIPRSTNLYLSPYFCDRVAVLERKGHGHHHHPPSWETRIVRVMNCHLTVWVESTCANLAVLDGEGKEERKHRPLQRVCLDDITQLSDGMPGVESGSQAHLGDARRLSVWAKFRSLKGVESELIFGALGPAEEDEHVLRHLLRVLHRSHWDPSTLPTSFIVRSSGIPKFAKPPPRSRSSSSLSSLNDSSDSCSRPPSPASLDRALMAHKGVDYPEWRTKVFERAKSAGRGFRCQDEKDTLKEEELRDLAKFFRGIATGEITIDAIRDGVYETANDCRRPPSPLDDSHTGRMTPRYYDDEEDASENEWENWRLSIERQKRRNHVHADRKWLKNSCSFMSGSEAEAENDDADGSLLDGWHNEPSEVLYYQYHSPKGSGKPSPIVTTKVSDRPRPILARSRSGATTPPTSPMSSPSPNTSKSPSQSPAPQALAGRVLSRSPDKNAILSVSLPNGILGGRKVSIDTAREASDPSGSAAQLESASTSSNVNGKQKSKGKSKRKEKEKTKGKRGGVSSMRIGASAAVEKGKKKLSKGLNEALDFVDGK